MKQKNIKILKKSFICLIFSMLFLNPCNLFAMDPPTDPSSQENDKKPRKLVREASAGPRNFIRGKGIGSSEPNKNNKRKSWHSLSSKKIISRENSETERDSNSLSTSTPSSRQLSVTEEELLDSPTLPRNDQEVYMEIVVSLLKSDKTPGDIAQILTYTYPVFMNEKSFFTQLIHFKQDYAPIIAEFLHCLRLEDFPNGIQNLQTATEELNALKKDLGDFSELDKSILNKISQKDHNNEVFKKLTSVNNLNKSEKINGENLDIGGVSNALLARDKTLFSCIHLSDIRKSEDMKTLIMHADHTSRWIAMEIIAALTPRAREKLVEKFSCLGRYLLENRNFHGAIQVALAFAWLPLKRILEADRAALTPSEIEVPKSKESSGEIVPFRKLKVKNSPLIQKDKGVNLQVLSAFAEPQYSHKAYRNRLSETQKKFLNFMPFFQLICTDCNNFYDGIELQKESSGKIIVLQKMAEILKTFSSYRTFPFPDVDDKYLNFVSNFDVHEETLNVFSDLRLQWPILAYIDTQKLIPLKEWTPWYFYSFLKERGCTKTEEIFSAGIHEGKHIISYMGTIQLDIYERKYMEPIRLNIQEDKHIIHYMRRGEIKTQMKKLNQLGLNEKMAQDIVEAYGLELIKDMKKQNEHNWELIHLNSGARNK